MTFGLESSWYGCSYDGLIVDGTTYCGDTGPQGWYVDTTSSITFYSDWSVSDDGFHICMSDAFTGTLNPWPTQSPTITCDDATHFSLTSGDCHVCGACIHSPIYLAGNEYEHNHCLLDTSPSPRDRG